MPATILIVAVKSYIDAVTSHVSAVTAYTHPFESTETAHEKMMKLFLCFFTVSVGNGSLFNPHNVVTYQFLCKITSY